MSTPTALKFAKSHEWVKEEGDSVVSIGISDHAQDNLGDITFVELPQVGATLEKGESFGVIESVKAASDLYAPVSGEVTEINGELDAAPEKINQSPYTEGWMLKIRMRDPGEIDSLLSPEEYEKLV